jgi:hypothetical protein
MTVGSSELDIDDNNQEKCYNNNNRENKNKTQTTSFSSTTEETNNFISSANQIPPLPKLQQLKMGRRKQNCPQKTGLGSLDGKS